MKRHESALSVFARSKMTKIDKPQTNKNQQPSKGPVVQQFASGGSAVPTPELPYDIEKVQGGKIKPETKPEKG
jgi:hypothetical protein